MIKKNNQGFTLIELLIVIVLIGILSGVLLSVIQPGAQRERAQQAVMRENLDKLLMAVQACINSRSSVTVCRATSNSAADQTTFFLNGGVLGVNRPNDSPIASTVYRVYPSGTDIALDVALGGTFNAGTSTTVCEMRYILNTTTGLVTTRTFSPRCMID